MPYDNSKQEQFIDAESQAYFSQQEQKFSHQGLVMEALRKCLEAGTHEMRTGYWNEKEDSKGNVSRVYIEDTRNKLIECIRTAANVMVCDFDKDANDKIPKLKKKLLERKKELLKMQDDWFKGLNPNEKRIAQNRYGLSVRGAFNTELLYYHSYKEKELEIFRLIFDELTELTKRLGFYETTRLIDE